MKGLAIYSIVIIGLVLLYGLYQLYNEEIDFMVFAISVGLYLPVLIFGALSIAKINNKEGKQNEQK